MDKRPCFKVVATAGLSVQVLVLNTVINSDKFYLEVLTINSDRKSFKYSTNSVNSLDRNIVRPNLHIGVCYKITPGQVRMATFRLKYNIH